MGQRFFQSDMFGGVDKPSQTSLKSHTGVFKRKVSKSLDCESCGLYTSCKTPKQKVIGKGKRGVLIISEVPRNEELLRNVLDEIGIDLDNDCWKVNAIRCYTKDKIKPAQIKACYRFLKEDIETLKPKKIILLGASAIESFMVERPAFGSTVSEWVGWKIPDQKFHCWVYPTWHPNFILRDEKNKALQDLFQQHLKMAFTHDAPLQTRDDFGKMVVLEKEEEVLKYLSQLNRIAPPFLAFDVECNCLNPRREGAELVTMSFCSNTETAVAFPIFENRKQKLLLKQILTNPKIQKVAHNAKFDAAWIRERFGYEVNYLSWDSMLAAHIIDNRSGICGLKFQTYINFGVDDYDSEMKSYLTGDESGFNRIKEAPLDKLLLYNGLDSFYTFLLYQKQQEEISKRWLEKPYYLFHNGMKALMDCESFGISLDIDSMQEEKLKLNKRAERLLKQIQMEIGPVNVDSSKDLKEYLFHKMKFKSQKQTAKGNESVDEEALELIKDEAPFVKRIIERRGIQKLSGTYIEGFERACMDGKMFPSFNLHTVATYRSSSSNPNFQNIPKRDEGSASILRSAIIPSEGFYLLEADYSAIEVRIAACVTKDEELIAYINDSTRDMHRDQAAALYLLKEKEVTKKLRYYAKNCFVFPEFYGSYWENCGKNLWENSEKELLADGTPVHQHLKNKGIKNLDAYLQHVKKEEEKFWKKYDGYYQWKEKALKDYQNRKFVETLMGFICSGVMTRNQVLNFPIQGTAFHCLLWSLIRCNKIRKEEGWKSRCIGQIHDSMVWEIHQSEVEIVPKRIKQIMTEDIRKDNPWIIVPLDVEMELFKTNWSKGEKI